jgi:hypothetical protein
MTRAQRNELLSAAVRKLEAASKLLSQADEGLLSDQVNEMADLVDVLTAVPSKPPRRATLGAR